MDPRASAQSAGGQGSPWAGCPPGNCPQNHEWASLALRSTEGQHLTFSRLQSVSRNLFPSPNQFLWSIVTASVGEATTVLCAPLCLVVSTVHTPRVSRVGSKETEWPEQPGLGTVFEAALERWQAAGPDGTGATGHLLFWGNPLTCKWWVRHPGADGGEALEGLGQDGEQEVAPGSQGREDAAPAGTGRHYPRSLSGHQDRGLWAVGCGLRGGCGLGGRFGSEPALPRAAAAPGR